MPGLVEAFERIGAFLEHRLPLTHAAGAALAVTDGEEILGVVVRGLADAASGTPVRPETRFEIGSISKSFAGIIAMQEAEAGRLDLHMPVNVILPWLELPEPFGPITTHNLLSHTSGLAIGTEDAPTGPGAAWNLRRIPPTFAPGERFWYSNDGWKLVGMVLERVTATPIHELVRQRVLAPLGMRSSEAEITNSTRTDIATGYETALDDRPPRIEHPLVPARWTVSNTADGSVVSNVIDMGAYARMLLGRGTSVAGGHDVRLLSDTSFDLLTTPVLPDPAQPGFGYAYGLQVGNESGHQEIAHPGGMVGYTSLLVVRPDEAIACVMLLNGDGDSRPAVEFALDVVGAALEGNRLPEVEHPSPSAVANAADYVGHYRCDEHQIEVNAIGDGIFLRDGAAGAALQPADVDVFLVAHPNLDRFAITFVRDGSGRVVEAFWGNEWFVEDAFSGPQPQPHPKEWEAYPGLYRANNPWLPTLRVLLRKGALALACSWTSLEEPLLPLKDGAFAVGEEWQPQRVRFDGVVEGRASVVEFNAGRWYRSFEA